MDLCVVLLLSMSMVLVVSGHRYYRSRPVLMPHLRITIPRYHHLRLLTTATGAAYQRSPNYIPGTTGYPTYGHGPFYRPHWQGNANTYHPKGTLNPDVIIPAEDIVNNNGITVNQIGSDSNVIIPGTVVDPGTTGYPTSGLGPFYRSEWQENVNTYQPRGTLNQDVIMPAEGIVNNNGITVNQIGPHSKVISPGTAVDPSVLIPNTDNSIRTMHPTVGPNGLLVFQNGFPISPKTQFLEPVTHEVKKPGTEITILNEGPDAEFSDTDPFDQLVSDLTDPLAPVQVDPFITGPIHPVVTGPIDPVALETVDSIVSMPTDSFSFNNFEDQTGTNPLLPVLVDPLVTDPVDPDVSIPVDTTVPVQVDPVSPDNAKGQTETLQNVITSLEEEEIRNNTCHVTGCSTGHECVFGSEYICPIYIPYVSCSCVAGCRLDYQFIPYSKSIKIDECGNTCSCNNMLGAAECTQRMCNPKNIVPEGMFPEIASPPPATVPVLKESLQLPGNTTTDIKSSDNAVADSMFQDTKLTEKSQGV